MYKEKVFQTGVFGRNHAAAQVTKFLNENKITKDQIVSINFWYDTDDQKECASVIYID